MSAQPDSLQIEIVGLSIAYAVLGALLLLAVVRARLRWGVKAAAVLVTSAFYGLAFFRIEGMLGWSASAQLPPRFQLLWTRTVEPNQVDGEPGAIHLWVEELDSANLPSGIPRAYRLPYGAALAQKAEAARTQIMAGHAQAGRAEDYGAGGGTLVPGGVVARNGAEAGGDPSGGGLIDSAFLRGRSKHVEFAPLPAPRLPAKDAP